MLTTFQRILDAYKRKVRCEAQLSYRESDRRVPGEEWTWVRWRGIDNVNGTEAGVGPKAQTAEDSTERRP